jgi:hypothetical protein
MRFTLCLLLCLAAVACNNTVPVVAQGNVDSINTDTVKMVKTADDRMYASKVDTIRPEPASMNNERSELVAYAKTLLGTPYEYGSKNPTSGFDCSGFVYYVFTHFNIVVPRSSVEYTNLGREVSVQDAKPGDLILFTGTDATIRVVGHMGIVTENTDSLRFIHASSGQVYAVTTTSLNDYYQTRFMKIIDIFPTDINTVPTITKSEVKKIEHVRVEEVVSLPRSIRHHLYVRSSGKHQHLSKRYHVSKAHYRSSTLHRHSLSTHHLKEHHISKLRHSSSVHREKPSSAHHKKLLKKHHHKE